MLLGKLRRRRAGAVPFLIAFHFSRARARGGGGNDTSQSESGFLCSSNDPKLMDGSPARPSFSTIHNATPQSSLQKGSSLFPVPHPELELGSHKNLVAL